MKILVIALSARSFVQAAVSAGYQVTAIDAFGDKQTAELADSVIVVDYDADGFNAESLLKSLSGLDASEYLGFVYGSGFEAQPDLLDKVALKFPLIGNQPETVRVVKTARDFFAGLDTCKINYPEVSYAFTKFKLTEKTLLKVAGGCGGMHIRYVTAESNLHKSTEQSNRIYFQKYIEGRSVSLLFLANRIGIEVIGFNEQWLSSDDRECFCYGGAVSCADLSKSVEKQLIRAAEKLSLHFGLIGLNSIDAVVKDEVVYVLEINPRLSATVDLYENAHLLERHVQICTSAKRIETSVEDASFGANKAKAHSIVFANKSMAISTLFDWPSWVVDTPKVIPAIITLGAPICTVFAYADSAEEAKLLANDRVKKMQQLLQKNNDKN